tara:strand:- start:853 stop:2550 length:1698 start_codon:yes stop_codon:yes gene_type:complete
MKSSKKGLESSIPSDSILKFVLKNALDFGKVNSNAVLGKVLAENPTLKKKIQETREEIIKLAEEVEQLSKKDIKERLSKFDFKEKKKVKRVGLKELPNAKPGKVIIRFAPSPSGALHLGHAHGLMLSYAYAKKYKGKLILRIEDTNPDNIYPQAYELIEEDAKWLTKNLISNAIVQSERLGYYYDVAEELIKQGHAYVSFDSSDVTRTKLFKKRAPEGRNLSVAKQHIRYQKMFSEYKPGHAVLRLKTDLKHKNPAMRDYPIMRINDTQHAKAGTNHRVWPLMNLSVAVDDHLMGVTHTIRGKDHQDNEKRQQYIFDYMKWKAPTHLYVGRINFDDLKLSSSKTRELIEYGKFTGWDDIRLPFLPALRRRGYQPGAFLKYSIEMGVTENDKQTNKKDYFKALNAFNKDIIDSEANRYFFVHNPKKIKIDHDIKRVSLNLHPDDEKRGKRTFSLTKNFFIQSEDLDKLIEDKIHRLMDCLNFTVQKNKFIFHSKKYEEYKEAKNRGMIIHWLPDTENNKMTVLTEDGKMKGVGEKKLLRVKEDIIVQLERVGFARMDKKELWYLHR